MFLCSDLWKRRTLRLMVRSGIISYERAIEISSTVKMKWQISTVPLVSTRIVKRFFLHGECRLALQLDILCGGTSTRHSSRSTFCKQPAYMVALPSRFFTLLQSNRTSSWRIRLRHFRPFRTKNTRVHRKDQPVDLIWLTACLVFDRRCSWRPVSLTFYLCLTSSLFDSTMSKVCFPKVWTFQ